MPVTEIATFELVEPNTLQSEPIASLLSRGIRNQITYSSIPVYLFTEVSDGSSVYLISGWPSIERHKESISSEINMEVMKQLIPTYATFKGIAHPTINFNTFPIDVSVVVVQKFVAEEGADRVKDIFVPAKWMYAGVDEHGEGYRVSAYGTEEGAEVLKTAESVTGAVVLKRAQSFEVDSAI